MHAVEGCYQEVCVWVGVPFPGMVEREGQESMETRKEGGKDLLYIL